jgi:hypothetical protein
MAMIYENVRVFVKTDCPFVHVKLTEGLAAFFFFQDTAVKLSVFFFQQVLPVPKKSYRGRR